MKRNKIRTLKKIIGILAREVGWFWLPLLWMCVMSKKRILSTINWPVAGKSARAYAADLALAAALYLRLKKKYNQEQTTQIMRKIIIPLGCAELAQSLEKVAPRITEPMERLIAFTEIMDKEGISQYNENVRLVHTPAHYHFVMKRCVIYDFFKKAGVPELTRIFCTVDGEFMPKAFPEFRFHRKESWENTIAYGKDGCEFVFEMVRKGEQHDSL